MEDDGGTPFGSEQAPLRLSRKVVWVWRIPALVAVAIVTIVVFSISASLEPAAHGFELFIPASFVVVIGGIPTVVFPVWRYRRWRYWVTPDTIEIRHGIWTRVEASIPHFRIQHIDLHQDPLQRLCGVTELRISTASVTADAKLPGIARDQATRVRHLMLERAADDDAV